MKNMKKSLSLVLALSLSLSSVAPVFASEEEVPETESSIISETKEENAVNTDEEEILEDKVEESTDLVIEEESSEVTDDNESFPNGTNGNTIWEIHEGTAVIKPNPDKPVGSLEAGQMEERIVNKKGPTKPESYKELINFTGELTVEEGVKLPANCASLFADYQASKLYIDNIDTSSVIDMEAMFSKMENLTELSLGNNFDTSNVENMTHMFEKLSNLEELNLGDKFDTSSVTKMWGMFLKVSGVEELDLGDKFNTENVTDMDALFSGMSSIKILDLGDKFDTSNVRKMNAMFCDTLSLTKLNLGDKFDTSNVTSMRVMFWNAGDNLKVDVSNFSFASLSGLHADEDIFKSEGIKEIVFGDNTEILEKTEIPETLKNNLQWVKTSSPMKIYNNYEEFISEREDNSSYAAKSNNRVYYDLNGGDWNEDGDSQLTTDEYYYIISVTPTKKGYRFLG